MAARNQKEAVNGIFSNIRRLISSARSVKVDLLEYDNPPAVFQDNDLITEARLQAVAGTGTSALPPNEQSYSGVPDDVVTLTPPAGYYAAKAYVVNADGYADWSRIFRNPDGTYSLRLLDATTYVMFI